MRPECLPRPGLPLVTRRQPVYKRRAVRGRGWLAREPRQVLTEATAACLSLPRFPDGTSLDQAAWVFQIMKSRGQRRVSEASTMRHTLLLFALSLPAFAEDAPLLAIPGKVIYESKLDTGLAAPWKAAKGKWEAHEGVLRGAEVPEDKHGAVARLPNQLQDFIAEFEFKFEGAKSTSLSINAVKGHMARVMITPRSVIVRRDDSDHEGPDKAVNFSMLKADLKPGAWHKVRIEMVGDSMLGQVDDIIATGSDALFTQKKAAPGFTVAGQSLDIRNFKLTEATLNPEWEKVKATLPKGEPLPAAKGKGKGKAKKAE
jgi:hypothetical protein